MCMLSYNYTHLFTLCILKQCFQALLFGLATLDILSVYTYIVCILKLIKDLC